MQQNREPQQYGLRQAAIERVNVTKEIETAPFGWLQIRVVALCAALVMLDGFDLQCISFIAPLISEEWQIEGSAFGPIFAAGLVGLMAGQLIFGPLADRCGRRPTILFCTLMFGLFTLLTGTARDAESLLVFRFLTGIGLGGVLPNIITLTSEFSPSRLRATMITVMMCGFPAGAVLSGLVSRHVASLYGWEWVFYIGGVLPLMLLLVLVAALPESMRFLIGACRPAREVTRLLKRISPEIQISDEATFVLEDEKFPGFSGKHLFLHGQAATTLLLWLTFFMSLLTVYFLVSWLPLLLRQSGLSFDTAVMSGVILNIGGGIGGILLGRLIDRYDAYTVLVFTYGLACVSVLVIASFGNQHIVLFAAVFCAGFCVIGGQTGLNALTAGVYPSAIRATGVGWALGVGRMGSIVGPVVGGLLLAMAWGPRDLLALGAVPATISAAMIAILGSVVRRRRPDALGDLRTS